MFFSLEIIIKYILTLKDDQHLELFQLLTVGFNIDLWKEGRNNAIIYTDFKKNTTHPEYKIFSMLLSRSEN